MSSSSLTFASSSQLESIIDATKSEYKKMTGIDLLDNRPAEELQSCDSAAAVLDIFQHQAGHLITLEMAIIS